MKKSNFKKISRSEVAFLFNVNPSTVSKWVKQGFPRNTDGSFSLRECIQWALDRIESERPSEGNTEAQRWLTEFRKERAKITALERNQREGSLISKVEVERQFTARCYEFSRTLLLMPRRISHRLAAKSKKQLREVEAILDDEVRRYLASYSRPIATEDGSG